MYEAIFILIGVFWGAIFGRLFFGRRGGTVATDQTCAYWCNGVKHTKKCGEGADAAGKCLDDLISDCNVA